MKKNWSEINYKIVKTSNFKEAKLLRLNTQKAQNKLKWKCILNFNLIMKFTTDWYFNYSKNKKNLEKFSIDQIHLFEKLKWKKNPK